MISNDAKEKIIAVWTTFTSLDNSEELNDIDDLDNRRLSAIEEVKEIIQTYLENKMNIFEFKSAIDSYNKRNNLWGFTGIKGQMFFNQLTNVNEENAVEFSRLLKETIIEPKDISDALGKIKELETHTKMFYDRAEDRRKVPKPSSCNYFLSYFWQIQAPNKWAVFYTSLLEVFKKLEIWEEQENQSQNFKYFYELNEDIKHVLSEYTNKEITNWDVEHAFDHANQKLKKSSELKVKNVTSDLIKTTTGKDIVTAGFELKDYLIPKVANLIELGEDNTKSPSAKGSEYEKLVAEIFGFLDFDIEVLGQGSGRNPDIILRSRENRTAFIVDAKAYSNGYSLGIDDRAIREYIGTYCPILYREGYDKIGFIIVSNSFKSDFDGFINDVTWNTQIKRFVLITSEALLYLLAYKTKINLSSSQIIEKIVSAGNLMEAHQVIEEFDDV